MLAVRFPRLRIPRSFLFFVRHFGTGVLVATAFVHLLPTAFLSLGNPCLSQFWTEDYPAMPGAIALAAVFFVTMVEMVFSPARHICGNSREVTQMICNPRSPLDAQPGMDSQSGDNIEEGGHPRSHVCHSHEPGRPATSHQSTKDPKIETNEDAARVKYNESGELPPLVLTAEQKMQKAFMQCVLLEVGILFHSVFIGMALSVSVGNEFVILLVAIAFHRTYTPPFSN